MNLQDLIDELRLKMKKVQQEAEIFARQINHTGKKIYIQHDDKMLFNPLYLGVEEYFQIIELEKFLLKYPELNNKQLAMVLDGNVFHFSFLRTLHDIIPDLAETVRVLGSNVVACMYVGTRLENALEV